MLVSANRFAKYSMRVNTNAWEGVNLTHNDAVGGELPWGLGTEGGVARFTDRDKYTITR